MHPYMNKLIQLASHFAVEGPIAQVKPLGEGFINDTYTVTLEGQDQPSYILQRKNHIVFPDVPAMMDNIDRVTRYIKSRVHDPLRQTLTIVPAKDGKLYYKQRNGNYWAMTLFIRDTMSYTKADKPEIAFQGGLGLGQFHRLVDGFNEPLTEVIKGFHNIRWRFTQWDEALARDAAGRVRDLGEEIGWIESRREPDLSKVSMSLRMFQAYMEGYLSMMKEKLTASEVEYLAFSGLYITYEQVLRFLMDYIDGDTYYKIRYPEHNLVRTRAQYKLLTSMEEQLPEMDAIVRRLIALP